MRKTILSVALVSAASSPCRGAADPVPLFQTPAVSKAQIAFAYGGDIWTTPRAGGEARRLVEGSGRAAAPVFSPDGTTIAFTAAFDDNADVYVVPAAGGEVRRLTWHPGADVAVAWTPDGQRVLFRSGRDSATDSARLYTVPLQGSGLPEALPLPTAEDGSFSPDGRQVAYSPFFQWESEWRLYRGGQTTPIWIARLSDSSVVKIPRDGSSDRNPMWVGTEVYFLSDRNGPFTLFSYDTETGKVRQVVENHGFDIDAASAGPDAIVYSQMGSLHLVDLATGVGHQVPVRVAADLPQLRPRFEKVAKQIVSGGISPAGARAVFEAHGEILTVPAEKGSARNLTATPAAMERHPAWSPDGRWIAWFSDESGEYALHVGSQDGLGAVRTIDLGQPPSFFYSPVWSPDSKKICYRDKRLNLWFVELAHPQPIRIDTDLYDTPLHEFDQTWSPDSRWIAYTKQLPNHLRAVFVYSLASRKATEVTDGMSDALYPAFDRSGKYLFFTASTDVGLSAGWLDMSSEAHPVTRSVYAAVLRKDLPSPVPPESDDEKPADPSKPAAEKSGSGKKADVDKDKDKKDKKEEPAPVSIDFDGLLQRIVSLPVSPANYTSLVAGKEGQLFLLEAPLVDTSDGEDGGPALAIQKFDLKTRKTDKLAEGVKAFALSFDGEKMLYRQKDDWFIAKTDAPAKAGEGRLATAEIEVRVEPRAEWRHMYHEAWRIERDFFYDPGFHGLDLAAAEKTFAPYLEGLASRRDLNVLFHRMLAYLSAGHLWVGGGTQPKIEKVSVGLLGADYEVAQDRYRFAKVLSGENWNPQLHAPLTQPGVNVAVGEFLLAVNGHELRASDNLYRAFQATAGKQTILRVGPTPDGTGARDVTVAPLEDEVSLRRLDWIEGNRRKVDALSGGRLAYVHLPDTASEGFTSFNRYFFAQVGKQGAILDERYNHGGQLADYVVDQLRRPVLSWVAGREGSDYASPGQSIYGPKAMIIDRFAGSGGDALPWYFRKLGIGPLIGERTWGGLIGIGGYPRLMDGGRVMAPRWALYGLKGEWEVENQGVAPDIEVWQDPKLVREGHDPQLEKAVEVLLRELAEHPAPKYPRPPYPNYRPVLPPVGR